MVYCFELYDVKENRGRCVVMKFVGSIVIISYIGEW